MVAFIELPCNLHFAPLGLPARAPPVLGGVHRSAFFDWAQWRRKIRARTERRGLGSPAGPVTQLVPPLVILHEVAALRVDAERFAAMGDSAGGHLAALLGLTGSRDDLVGEVGGTTGSSAVQAVIDWFGPAELLTMREQALPYGMRGMDDADSPESLVVAVRFTNTAKGLSQLRLLFMSLDRRRRSTFSTARVTASCCFWGVDNDGIVERDVAFLRSTFVV
jgi:BD-FAE protein